jgi:hypothetical protein
MKIAARYSFNGGAEAVNEKYPHLLAEVEAAIAEIDASKHRIKTSKEKTKKRKGKLLYSPVSLNKAFKATLFPLHWKAIRESCEYSTEHYAEGYTIRTSSKGAFREMDFVKEKLGVEVQFGKYSFMVYNVCAKMTIFRNCGHIDTGIEIVPVKAFSAEMSRGVSYFEQFVWDLDARGIANIDVPVLILGIDND